MVDLDRAISIAVRIHQGQKDRYGKPYILHPLRIMMQFRGETEMTVAILHDVIEDSDWTLQNLREAGFSEEIVSAVDSLSKRENEAYTDYIKRITKNKIAIRVKLADLEDNMNIQRMDKMREKDLPRLQRYHDAWNRLKKII